MSTNGGKVVFTKGPWFADDHGNIWRRDPSELYQYGGTVGGDRPLATASRGFYGGDVVGYAVDANARLIAAAPDLLEALKALSEACYQEFGCDDLNEDGDFVFEDDDTVADPDCPITFGMLRKARAAIARAEGEG